MRVFALYGLYLDEEESRNYNLHRTTPWFIGSSIATCLKHFSTMNICSDVIPMINAYEVDETGMKEYIIKNSTEFLVENVESTFRDPEVFHLYFKDFEKLCKLIKK